MDQLIVLFEREVDEDAGKVRDIRRLSSELREAVRRRDGYVAELKASRSYDDALGTIEMLTHMQLDDMEKAARLLLMARESQIKVDENTNFIMRMRDPKMDAPLPLLEELTRAVESNLTKDQLIVLFEREVDEDAGKVRDIRRLSSELREAVRRRDGYVAELKASRSYDDALGTIEMMTHMQLDDMEKAARLLLMARESQIKVDENTDFIMRMRDRVVV
nr:hypothetical protein [Tanacetum cinerariifolium]